MKQGLVRLLYNFCKRFMGWTLHMIMCVLLCYPVSIHMSQLLSTGRPISSYSYFKLLNCQSNKLCITPEISSRTPTLYYLSCFPKFLLLLSIPCKGSLIVFMFSFPTTTAAAAAFLSSLNISLISRRILTIFGSCIL